MEKGKFIINRFMFITQGSANQKDYHPKKSPTLEFILCLSTGVRSSFKQPYQQIFYDSVLHNLF